MGIFANNKPIADVRAGDASATDVFIGERLVWPIEETPVDVVAFVCDRFVDDLLVPLVLHTPDIDTVAGGWKHSFGTPTSVLIWNGGWEEQGNTCKEVGSSSGGYCAKVFGEPSLAVRPVLDTTGIEVGKSKVVIFAHFYGSCIDHRSSGVVIASDLAGVNYTSVNAYSQGVSLERVGGPTLDILIDIRSWIPHDNFTIEVTRYVATGNIDVEVITYCGDTIIEVSSTLNYVVGSFPGDSKYLGFQVSGLEFARCEYFKAIGIV